MNSQVKSAVSVDDVQSLVLRASRTTHVQHIFVTFHSVDSGQIFMHKMQDKLSWGMNRSAQPFEVSMGVTFNGLEALSIPDGYLYLFRQLAPAFSEGAGIRAAEHLGDVGTSAARHWDDIFPPHNQQVHAVITIHGSPKTKEELQSWQDHPLLECLINNIENIQFSEPVFGQHLQPPSATEPSDGESNTDSSWHSPITEEFSQDRASSTPPVWVHFGYRDGLTSNHIRTDEPIGKTQQRAINDHEPGELLLGEPRNAGDNPWSLVSRSERIQQFFKHGSFGAFRQIEQNESAFRCFVKRSTDKLNQQWKMHQFSMAFVRAKLCGRWPNGQLVLPSDSTTDVPKRAIDLNDFTFNEHDKHGYGCPLASHIRRMNPRDEHGVQTHQRPLFRRGVPYGPWYDKDPTAERGLLGLFFCSSLEDQFEHLLGEWADRQPLGIAQDRNLKDPLVGTHTNADTSFSIEYERGDNKKNDKEKAATHSAKLYDFKAFVRTRGTVYCFYPSNKAIKELAEKSWIEKEDGQWLNL